jgi:hypothetical protein
LYEAAAGGAIEKMKQNAQKWWNQFVETIKRIANGTLKTKYMKKKEWIDSAAQNYGKKDGSAVKISSVELSDITKIFNDIKSAATVNDVKSIVDGIVEVRKAKDTEVTVKKGDVGTYINKYKEFLKVAAIQIPTGIVEIQHDAAMKKAMEKITLNSSAEGMKVARDEVAAAQNTAKEKLKVFSALISLLDVVLSDLEKAIKTTGGKEETATPPAGGGTPTPTPPAGGGTPQNESANLFAQFFSS